MASPEGEGREGIETGTTVVPIPISWELRRDRKGVKDRGAAHAVFYYIKGRSLGRGRGRDKEESTDIWLNNFKFRGQRLEHESCKPLASSIMQRKRRRPSAVENSGRRVAIARR